MKHRVAYEKRIGEYCLDSYHECLQKRYGYRKDVTAGSKGTAPQSEV